MRSQLTDIDTNKQKGAMEETLMELTEKVLPGCFRLTWKTVPVTAEGFPGCLRDFLGDGSEPIYMDVYRKGLTASLALALWFMEFDEDNWFSFQDVHDVLKKEFLSRKRVRERLELILVKGSFPPMMLDQPVLVDHREGTVTFLFGELLD